MGAIQPEQATVYITAQAVSPSAIASSDSYTGYITNFSESGGEEDVESNPVFGGGNIDKIKPRSQIEVSFDVIFQYGTNASDFDAMKWGSTLLSDGDSPAKRVYIEFSDGTNYYTRGYDNCKAVSFEPESSADDFLKGTITFKLSPTQSDGTPNLQILSGTSNSSATDITWS